MLTVFSTCAMAATIASATSASTDLSPTNVVVDFDATKVDANMMPGDSGILNLVITNTGGQAAENVQVWLPSNAILHIDKRFYIGRMEVGESKTTPVLIRVENTAKTGLTGIQVSITYDGFDSDGTKKNNEQVSMEIPLRIFGNPLFQLTPSKTTYYKDNAEELSLEGLTMTSVKDMEATLSSSCLTVIGSSRNFVGDISAKQNFNLIYQIKPASAGACIASVRLSYTDESGSKVSDNVSIGLNVEDAGVDFKVTNVSYSPTGPGEQTDMKITLKNVGSADASDVTAYLDLTSPFSPVDTAEKYVSVIRAGQDIDIDFGIAVDWTASTTSYSIPLYINYKVGGTSYTINKSIGIDVSGKVILQIMSVQSSGGSIRIDIANIGTRDAAGVKATLVLPNTAGIPQGGFNRTRQAGDNASQFARNISQGGGADQRIISYKSDIKPSKDSTFTFSTSATGPATLELEYTGFNNERVTQTERITLGGSGVSGTRGSSSSNGSSGISTTTLVLAAAALIVVYLAYRRIKRRKSK